MTAKVAVLDAELAGFDSVTRRLAVPTDQRLTDLHRVLQEAFDATDPSTPTRPSTRHQSISSPACSRRRIPRTEPSRQTIRAGRDPATRADHLALLRHRDQEAERERLGCKADDIVDALVALWSAERIGCGAALSIPVRPPLDAYGLRMEMMA